MLKAYSKLLDVIEKIEKAFLAAAMAVMIVDMIYQVIMRYIFNSANAWSEELARYLFVFVTYIGAISAMRANAHLGVDTLISRMKPQVQMVMYVLSQLIITALMVILIQGSMKMVAQNTQSRTAALGIPYAFLYSVGILTGAAIAILAILNIVHALKNPSKISEIVTMSTSDDDEIAADAKDGLEELSDEEYARRLREEGGK